MNAAKWIIGFILAGVLAYIIYDQKFNLPDENPIKETPKSGVEVKKRFDDDGNLKAEAEYLDGMRHGVAKNYYPDGSVHSEIHYKKNKKEGNSTWYYENGKPYRVTPFKSGKKHGVQKKYYESGKLMAEIPYENGKLIAGTKEFSKDGDIITDTPEILVKERNLTLLQGTYYVEAWLKKPVGKTEFYRLKDKNTQLFPEKLENGHYRFGFLSVPNNTEFVEFTIYAKTRSKMNNPILVKKDMRIVLGG